MSWQAMPTKAPVKLAVPGIWASSDRIEASKVWGDMMRNPQAFGPEVDAPADASDQDKLLAYLGRQP